ncbi:hypothetical protein, partial [Sphingomonas adhaesiva]
DPQTTVHMSLHLNHNVKEPTDVKTGQPSYPAISIGGLGVRLMWRPMRAAERAAPRRWSGFYARVPTSSNTFCNFLSLAPKTRGNLRFLMRW